MKLNLFLLFAAAMVNAASGTSSTVDLQSAGNYAILAKTGISTVPTSAITGDIAVSPIAATAITGFSLVADSTTMFSKSTQVVGDGKVYAASYGGQTAVDLTAAISAMETAYTEAALLDTSVGRIDTANGWAKICDGTNGCAAALNVDDFLNLESGEIGGLTLGPGVYNFTTDITINDDVTFDANSDSDAIFIIQTTGSVKQAFDTRVTLQNDAKAHNIFWQVAQEVIVEPSSTMIGVLLVKEGVTIKTGSTVLGRILTQTAVALQIATITPPV